MPSAATRRSCSKDPITRTVEDAALALTALAGYDPRDPYSLDEQVDFTAATRRSIRGWKIAYSPDFDVFPVDRRVADVVGRAVKAFEEAGAHVEEIKVGIKRPQKELSDLWCRLIMPLNVQTFEILKGGGLDLLKDHRDDFPPEYLRWIDAGYRMSALDFFQDQEVRTGGLRRHPGRVESLRPADHADARLPAGRQRGRRQHHRADHDQRRGGEP